MGGHIDVTDNTLASDLLVPRFDSLLDMNWKVGSCLQVSGVFKCRILTTYYALISFIPLVVHHDPYKELKRM